VCVSRLARAKARRADVIEQILFCCSAKVRFSTKRTWRHEFLFVRFRGEPDMRCDMASTPPVAYDPKRT